MTRIHGFEPKNVAEKCAVRLGVFPVDDYVSARKSLAHLRENRSSIRSGSSL
jgi:hypothetical protein